MNKAEAKAAIEEYRQENIAAYKKIQDASAEKKSTCIDLAKTELRERIRQHKRQLALSYDRARQSAVRSIIAQLQNPFTKMQAMNFLAEHLRIALSAPYNPAVLNQPPSTEISDAGLATELDQAKNIMYDGMYINNYLHEVLYFLYFSLGQLSLMQTELPDCVRLEHSKQYGNHVVASRAIKHDEIVAYYPMDYIRFGRLKKIYKLGLSDPKGEADLNYAAGRIGYDVIIASKQTSNHWGALINDLCIAQEFLTDCNNGYQPRYTAKTFKQACKDFNLSTTKDYTAVEKQSRELCGLVELYNRAKTNVVYSGNLPDDFATTGFLCVITAIDEIGQKAQLSMAYGQEYWLNFDDRYNPITTAQLQHMRGLIVQQLSPNLSVSERGKIDRASITEKIPFTEAAHKLEYTIDSRTRTDVGLFSTRNMVAAATVAVAAVAYALT